MRSSSGSLPGRRPGPRSLLACAFLGWLGWLGACSAEDSAGPSASPTAAREETARASPASGPQAAPRPAEPGRGGLSLAPGQDATQDLGVIREGEARSATFELVSDGEEPLVIHSAKPSCGCTVVDLFLLGEDGEQRAYATGDPIPPGERLGLTSRLYTQGKRGELRLMVTLRTNTPQRALNVIMEAEVEPVLDVSPGLRLAFGPMGPGDRETRVVSFRSRRGEPFRLTTRGLPAGLEVALAPTSPDGDGRSNAWNGMVVLEPGFHGIPGTHSIQVATDLPIAEPQVPRKDGSPLTHSVVLVAEVTGMVEATPTTVSFGVVRPGQTVERTVRLSSADDFTFPGTLPVEVNMRGYELDTADLIRTEVVAAEDGAVDLVIVLTAPLLEEDLALIGTLELGVGHPQQESLVLRFSAVCRIGS